jgi:hypothetical protein
MEVVGHSHLLLHCMEVDGQLDSPVAVTSRALPRLPIEHVSSEMESLPVWEMYHIPLSGIYHIMQIYFALDSLK